MKSLHTGKVIWEGEKYWKQIVHCKINSNIHIACLHWFGLWGGPVNFFWQHRYLFILCYLTSCSTLPPDPSFLSSDWNDTQVLLVIDVSWWCWSIKSLVPTGERMPFINDTLWPIYFFFKCNFSIVRCFNQNLWYGFWIILINYYF